MTEWKPTHTAQPMESCHAADAAHDLTVTALAALPGFWELNRRWHGARCTHGPCAYQGWDEIWEAGITVPATPHRVQWFRAPTLAAVLTQVAAALEASNALY